MRAVFSYEVQICLLRCTETSVDNYFTRQYIPEDKSEHHTRRRENLKSHSRIKWGAIVSMVMDI
jgi:hypothetical protein